MSKRENPLDKPYPIRLGNLKPPLQQEACQDDRSLAYLIKKILKSHVESKNIRDKKPT